MIGLAVKEYPEIKGEITGKKLRAASSEEVEKFNDDLVNIAAQFGMDAIRAAIDEYQEQIWTLVRQVMDQANAPYGGAGALGDEICIRALRPLDVGIAADIWDTDYTGIDVSTVANRQQQLFSDQMLEEEGHVIFGCLIEHGSNRVVNAYRWSKGGKNYPALTLPFTYTDPDRAQFVKLQVPIITFTEETLTFWVNVVRASWSYLALIGIYATRASNIDRTYRSGGLPA